MVVARLMSVGRVSFGNGEDVTGREAGAGSMRDRAFFRTPLRSAQNDSVQEARKQVKRLAQEREHPGPSPQPIRN